MKATQKQLDYLLSLINRATGNDYRYLSHVREDGLGKRANKVKGISKTEASALIDEWSERAEEAEYERI